MTKISIVLGTRPEIIKLSPIIRLTKKKNTDIIFSGQHYDYELGLRFIDELGLRKPDYKMRISKEDPTKQIGEMIQRLGDIFNHAEPDTVIVQGDTNTVLAGALAALKCNIPVSHVEAGLRSFDWRMPEEHNRIVADHISELLFASTETSKKNLIHEKVHGKIFVTGNTVIDAIEQNVKLAEKKSKIQIDDDFILLTLHRAENVDEKNTLENIIDAVIECGEKIIFPIHPRTLHRLKEFGLYKKIKNTTNLKLIDAVGYFDMIMLMKQCRFIVSDSGGIQEEATAPQIRKRVLVLRKTSDRPEAVKADLSEIVGTKKKAILESIKKMHLDSKYPNIPSPYGNGHSSEKILKIIKKHFGN